MNKDFIDQDVYSEIMSGVNLVSGDEFRTIMCTISQLSSDIVKKTLGPYGSTTIVDEGGGYVKPTKDGWSALSKIRFRDTIYNTAFNILKQISFNAVSAVGDGTTTAMVVANEFIQKALREGSILEPGFNQALYRKAADSVADELIARLQQAAHHIDITTDTGIDTIRQIAYIATNGNGSVADMIADIYKKTQNTNIHVQISQESEITSEIQLGYKIYARPLSFNAYVNADDNTILDRNTNVIVFDHNVTYVDHGEMIMSISKYASREDTEIIIMAPYFDDTIATRVGSQVLALQRQGQVSNVMLVQVPATTELQKKSLRDIALLTNATIIDAPRVKIFRMFSDMGKAQRDGKDYYADDHLLELASDLGYETCEDVIAKSIGSIHTIELHETEAFLRDYDDIVDHKMYKLVLEEAKKDYEEAQLKVDKTMNASLDKDVMAAHMRYVRLLGKTGIINVGGASDYQKSCDKDSIDDAVKVCASAVEDGWIRGMNLDTQTILRDMELDITEYSENLKDRVFDQYQLEVIHTLQAAFREAAMDVLRNGGTGDDQVWKVVDINSGDYSISGYDLDHMTNDIMMNLLIKEPYVYDMRTNLLVYSPEDGSTVPPVITSLRNDVEIVRAVISVLSVIITSNQFMSTTQVYDRKKTKAQGYADLSKNEMIKGGAFAQGILNTLITKKNIIHDLIDDILPKKYDKGFTIGWDPNAKSKASSDEPFPNFKKQKIKTIKDPEK